MSQPIRDQGSHLVFPIGPKNTKFVNFIRFKNGVYILVEVSILNFNYLVSVTSGGPVSPRGHM